MRTIDDKHTEWYIKRLTMESCKATCSDFADKSHNCGIRESENTFKDLVMDNINETNRRIDSLMPTSHRDGSLYDLIIFGASGSIGKFVVDEMALVVDKYYSNGFQQQSTINSTSGMKELRNPAQFAQNRRKSVPRSLDDVNWAVAGRSAMKLSETLCQAELSTGIKNLSNRVPVILADLNHQKSLIDMCLKTNLVINCAGPYSKTDSETLIKACIETKTNYIDLAHETTYIEQIRQIYSTRAKDAGIYIINGCGFQSMSVEMGLNFTKQVTDGKIEQVRVILSLSDSKAILRSTTSSRGDEYAEHCGIITPGMWDSWLAEKDQEVKLSERIAITERPPPSTPKVANMNDSSDQNQDSDSPDIRRPLLRRDTQSLVRDIVEFRNKSSNAWLQMLKGYDETGRGYCLPTNSFTSEEAQLIRGEMNTYEHRRPDLDSVDGWTPIRCTCSLSLKSVSEVFVTILWLLVINVCVRFSITRKLLKMFPRVASLGYVRSRREKLRRDNLSHIKFCQTFVAEGTPNEDSGDPLEKREKHLRRKREQLLVSRVVGPEPNHVATATYAVQAAITLISERDHLPIGGGVLTPGAAFSETNIIYQLRRRNIKFEVLRKA